MYCWDIELCLMLGGTKAWLAKCVSQLSIDHVVWVGDCTLWGFVLSHEYFIPTGHCKIFSEVVCLARRQYRDYIINLYCNPTTVTLVHARRGLINQIYIPCCPNAVFYAHSKV